MPSFSNHQGAPIKAPQSMYGKDINAQPSVQELAQFFEPAVERPPSPERLRQLSKQMKRASHLHRRPQQQQNVSSTSNTLYAMADQHPSGDSTTDNNSLSRYPSGRSSGSSTPSRERPESIFGKTLFQRKGKFSRETSTPTSSSAASFSSGEYSGEPSVNNLKESLMPNLFSRRKPSRDETAALAQRKLQISGPFNFQHVQHTNRDYVDCNEVGPSPGPTSAPVGGVLVEGDYFTGNERDDKPTTPNTAPLSHAPLSPAVFVKKLLKQTKSQDNLRSMSPTFTPNHKRNPSSTARPTSPLLPPVPPRTSSRQSIITDPEVPLGSTPLERPQTSSGFRRPRPFSPIGDELPPLPSSSHGAIPTDMGEMAEDQQEYSLTSPSTPDQSWPLGAVSPMSPAYDKSLPDVPEEEEHPTARKQSHSRVVSHSSSLRASHSVPLLRTAGQYRPSSSGSDTLGVFDSAAQLPVSVNGDETLFRESWEDDIDYIYEHEAEADCDYQWSRSSLDASQEYFRREQEQSGQIETGGLNYLGSAESSRTVESPAGGSTSGAGTSSTMYPTNQITPIEQHSKVTPSHTHHRRDSSFNFSLPNRKGSRPSMIKLSRSPSNASSFKEAHGFNLSPTLLIPAEYSETDKHESGMNSQPLFDLRLAQSSGSLSAERFPSSLQQRSSTSTTETNSEDSRSDTTGDRHVSANSINTSLTRLTNSTTSLNKLAVFASEEKTPINQPADFIEYDDEPEEARSGDTVPEMASLSLIPPRGKSLHRSHASESVVRPFMPTMKSSYEQRPTRPRARTSSLSQAPPVGQYAAFSRPHLPATGDRI